MPYRRIIPCLDVRDGRVVKGIRFESLRDVGDPVEAAQRYAEAGADELVLLDISATPDGRGHGLEVVRAVRAVLDIPLCVGGGVRTADDVAVLLDAGADKVAVNTAAVRRPALLSELAERFGRQCTVLALDAHRAGPGYAIRVRSGQEPIARDAVTWAKEASELGAGEILLTSYDRDGTGVGYDLQLLSAVVEAVRVPVIASGGVSEIAHLAQGLESGASAVLAASVFHSGRFTVAQVKRALREAGVEIRPC